MMSGPDAGTGLPREPAAGCAVFIAQHFLPLNIVASQRALRMARTLLTRFQRIYVLSGDASLVDPAFLDREYGKDVIEHPRLRRVVIRPTLARYGEGISPSPFQRLIGGAATRLLWSSGADWVHPLRRALAQIPASERVRVVLATGGPFITFGTAARFAAARRSPAILDYRDLWTSNPHAPYSSASRALINHWIERPVNRAARLITTVSEGCRASLVASGTTVPVRVLYNSPDRNYLSHYRDVVEEWRRRPVKPSGRARPHMQIVFTGQVYRKCTFAPVLKALSTLTQEVRDRIEFHYYGGASVATRLEFEQFGLAHLLTDHGTVSKDDSLRAMLEADLLLSLIHTDRISPDPAVTGHMSTKIYDYFLSGVPILNIGPVNAEVNDLAVKIGHAAFHTMPADDTAAIASLIEKVTVSQRTRPAEPLRVTLPDFDAAFSSVIDEALASS